MKGYLNEDGSPKIIDESYVKIDGDWKRVVKGYIKVDNAWKQWYLVPPNTPIISNVVDNSSSRPYNNGSFIVSISLSPGSLPANSFRVVASATGQPDVTSTSTNSTITLTGLKTGVSYNVVAFATNSDGESLGSAPFVKTATTVPQTINAPSVSTQVDQDNLSWTAPATGGSAIIRYRWESTDAKTNTTTSTSAAVAQEGGTSQQYRVRAENANGVGEWSAYSGSVTTTPPFFPFFPYFPPYFPPFFPFFPYFPPRFPFFPFFPFFPYFPPFFPNFSPLCIAADTLVMTVDGPVAAKDLRLGQKLVSFEIEEMGTEEEEEMFSWNSETLTLSSDQTETEIVTLVEKANYIIYFNGDASARYSTTQPVYVKIGDSYQIKTTGSLELGSILIKPSLDGSYEEVEIAEITVEDEVDITYQVNCEPYDWFIAGGYLVHNK